MRKQTWRQFVEEIDDAVKVLGVGNNITKSNMHLEDVVKVMIELMGRGYKRYPDLAR